MQDSIRFDTSSTVIDPSQWDSYSNIFVNILGLTTEEDKDKVLGMKFDSDQWSELEFPNIKLYYSFDTKISKNRLCFFRFRSQYILNEKELKGLLQ